MTHKIEFFERDNLGKGLYIAVVINRSVVGRIERNGTNDWCYFTGANELNPEIIGRELGAIKAKVTAKLSR